jgi:hypothetical protein
MEDYWRSIFLGNIKIRKFKMLGILDAKIYEKTGFNALI